jgi:protein gp37
VANWNPWHGCKKISPGCVNCYVYRIDARHGRDAAQVFQTREFDLPVRKDRGGNWKIPSGETVWTCFSSDFLLDTADSWRPAAWDMMRIRADLTFLFITKRIDRLMDCLPPDWGGGYPNVHICCTCETQERADARLPVFLQAPVKHKHIVCEPLLERLDLSPYLTSQIESLVAGGESGEAARPCDYDWILSLRGQCIRASVPFQFKQTGARFLKDGKLYQIRREDQHAQAKKAGINWRPEL